MPTTEKWTLGTTVTLLSTELDSLAASGGLTSGAISSVGGASGVFDNTQGGGGFDGYTLADYELSLAAPAGTLGTSSTAYVWFIGQVNGTNFEDGGASVIPARPADLIFIVRAVSTAQRIILKMKPLPPNTWKVLIANVTAQTWGASGNTLKVKPLAYPGD